MATKKEKECATILANWESLNAAMVDMNEVGDVAKKEKLLQSLLEYELGNSRRRQFIIRIHGKLIRVRAAREREEYLKIASN